MTYAFFGLASDGQYIPTDSKLHRVYQRIRREQPSVKCVWVYSHSGLKEAAPDRMFLQPPTEDDFYPAFLTNYPCEKDFLENWSDD